MGRQTTLQRVTANPLQSGKIYSNIVDSSYVVRLLDVLLGLLLGLLGLGLAGLAAVLGHVLGHADRLGDAGDNLLRPDKHNGRDSANDDNLAKAHGHLRPRREPKRGTLQHLGGGCGTSAAQRRQTISLQFAVLSLQFASFCDLCR